MAKEKERIDVLLVQQGLFASREQAKRAVMAGEVLGKNEQRLDKPGVKIPVETELHLKGNVMPYVSRGGLKLAKALDQFKIDVTDQVVLDIGSSTGGFTDVMLQKGARLSYALDVGTNQLVWKLRTDPRVIVMENTNFRYSQPADFTAGLPTFASIDVSFISLRLILAPLKQILQPHGEVVALIKPQFEAGREHVGKHGIVRDPAVHRVVIEKVFSYATTAGFSVLNLDFSPITGGEGNVEFLVQLQSTAQPTINPQISISAVQDRAYKTLQN
ncbi:TlyA family RNA methyltransferase [Fructilactobacillus myrtifloralis]|uniref:TlyA family RNA methyltransferase n=1 Tax=Fructilactobacillus myrtifloralis TaxID=2940301 RepID=A0ABY5BRS3_9LACO|nr:TlyA family RNA methyltransferase [Fructilactobacillus myrtifloralis]USS85286.1 TlyA family RNA methyltransferase [Fructilactobacillus myrtifloralis]